MAYSFDTINDFRVGFDFQREWVRGRGLFLLLAFYLGGLGGGLFVTSAIIEWKWGLAAGLGIVAVGKGSAHMAFLGHPLRFWRIVRRPHSSWISRGFIFMFMFLIFGTIYFFNRDNRALEGISAFWAIWLTMYTGFAMTSATAIAFWNNALLPMVFGTAAIWSGASLAEAVHAIGPDIGMDAGALEHISLIAGVVALASLLTYILVSYSSITTARQSVLFLTRSQMAFLFYGGVVVVGLIIPMAIIVPAFLGEVGRGWLALAGFSELAGSFCLRYALLRGGLYPPVI